MLLHRRVLDVDRADSRQLPDVDAGNLKRPVVFLPLVTTTTIIDVLRCNTEASIQQENQPINLNNHTDLLINNKN